MSRTPRNAGRMAHLALPLSLGLAGAVLCTLAVAL